MNPDELIEALKIEQWYPRVGDLVRRRDTKTVVGSIISFELTKTGYWANCLLKNESRLEDHRMLVGLLEPIGVHEIIKDHTGPLCRALEKMLEG